MDQFVAKIRADLKRNADDSTKGTFQRFFREEVRYHGVRTGTVNKIAKKYWKEVETLEKKEIFRLCEELYRSGYCEESFVVSNWVPQLADRFEPNDLRLFRRWIEKYIDNWAKCDGFCNHTVGSFVERYPESVQELRSWAGSENRWLKRAAAVSLIIPAKRGKFLSDIFEIADLLLLDSDDMVQKGYGWLLKEASRSHQKGVFDYVMRNKKVMPRTALRYAIELMPKELKSKAMQYQIC
jgi:3-methyladenine DNA glycosylase AlkD